MTALFQRPRRLAFCISAFVAGCSFAPEPPPPQEIPLRSVELYYNRASMDRARFEQFKVIGDTLYSECGTIAGGRHSSAQQNFSKLSNEALDEIRQDAWSVDRYVTELNAEFKAPSASTNNMFSPGKLTLKMQFAKEDGSIASIPVSTTFDAVAQAGEGKYLAVSKLALAIREAAGGKLCGDSHFFELGKPIAR